MMRWDSVRVSGRMVSVRGAPSLGAWRVDAEAGRGDRTGAFSWVDDEFLPPEEYVLATLIYEKVGGGQGKTQFKLKERCGRMLCHGPVRVPEDARPGPAKIRCEMSEESKSSSFATDIPVTIRAVRKSL